MKINTIIVSVFLNLQICLLTAIAQPTAVETFSEYTNGSSISSSNLNGGTGWANTWQWLDVGTATVSNGVLYCTSGGITNHYAEWRNFTSPVMISSNLTYYFRGDIGAYDSADAYFWGFRLTDGQGYGPTNWVADMDEEHTWLTSFIGQDRFYGYTIAYPKDGTVVHAIGQLQWASNGSTTNTILTVYILPVVPGATVPASQSFASTPTWIFTNAAPAVSMIGGVVLDGYSLSPVGVTSAQNLYFGTTWADVTPDAAPPSQPIVWQDADPANNIVSTTDNNLAVASGQPDPAGGTDQVGGVYYAGTPSQYANLAMAYGQAATVGPGTKIFRPFYCAGSEVASYTSNYFGGPITFSTDIYIPSGSAFSAQDSIFLQVSYWDDNLFSGSTYPQYNITAAANMQLLNQWQTITVTSTVPNTNILMYVQPTVVFDDANQDAGIGIPICYVRNVNFNMGLGPIAPPVLTAQRVGGNLVLNWTGSGFKLQTAGTLVAPLWTDYALPAGTNPPVSVPISAGNADAFFRLAHQ